MARILLVEDHEMNRKLFTDIFTIEHEVVAAASAEEALEVLQEFTPDLVLVDIQLPGMDGLTMTRQLKARPEFQAIPFVALSAHAMPEELNRAKECGCIDFITKPVTDDPFALLERIGGYMHIPPAWGEG